MTKVIVASLKSDARKGAANIAVAEKRIVDQNGVTRTLRTLDAGSQSFGNDLRYVFGKNVAKARRDNKRAIGVTDIAIKR